MLLSIIVTVYNLETKIKECLDSLVFQNNKDYEVIVVDDGSVDGSEKICKEITLKHNNFKYYKKSNGGISDTRNFGYKKSVGKYIWFFDGDDYCESSKINLIFDKLKENPRLLVFDYFEHYKDKNRRAKGWDGVYTSPVAVWNKIIARELINELFKDDIFPKNMIFEDYAIIPYICYMAKNIIYLEEPIYIYRISQGTSIMTKNRNNIDQMLKASGVLVNLFENIPGYIEKNELLEAVKPRLLDMLIKDAVFNKKECDDKHEMIMQFLNCHFKNNIFKGIFGLGANIPVILGRFFIQNKSVYRLIKNMRF